MDANSDTSPGGFLAMARSASEASDRAIFAQRGIARLLRHEAPEGSCPDVIEEEEELHWLLLRQLYLAQIELGQLQDAATSAHQMTVLGVMPDVTHHDAGRVLWALGRQSEAIWQQRLASRRARGERRAFHYWCLGTFLFHAGETEEALGAFKKAERWGTPTEQVLMRAHSALVRLAAGEVVAEVCALTEALKASSASEGYGQYVLGMLYAEQGDEGAACRYLRGFLRRHAESDAAVSLTLADEIHRARAIVAQVDPRQCD